MSYDCLLMKNSCMGLMEGADIYQFAKNCRTSIEMIKRFYAAHINSTLDAAPSIP